MKKFVVHTYTDYCGTDNYGVINAKDEYEAYDIARDIAYENALQYFDIVTDDEMEELEINDADTSDFITDEQWGYEVDEYDPAVHYPIEDYENWT